MDERAALSLTVESIRLESLFLFTPCLLIDVYCSSVLLLYFKADFFLNSGMNIKLPLI